MLSAFAVPWTGTTQPSQPSLRMSGAGHVAVQTVNGNYVTMYGAPLSGTMIDNRYAGGDGLGHTAKLDVRGFGKLEINHLSLINYGTDNYLFVQDSNTTLSIHDDTFLGNGTCFRMTCTQAAIQFGPVGGTVGTFSTSQPNAPYQGYNSHVFDNNFGHFAEGVRFGASANNVLVEGGNADSTNGSYLTTQGFIHFYGLNLGASANTLIAGNIESTGYVNPIVTTSTNGDNNLNVFVSGPQCSDSANDENNAYTGNGQPTVTCFNFDANANWNIVNSAPVDNGMFGNFITQAAVSPNNMLLVNYQNNPSSFPTGLYVNNTFAAGVPPGTTLPYPYTFGPGTGDQKLAINGGATNSGDGAAIFGLNNGTGCWFVGTTSAILGGSYNSGLTLGSNCTNVQIEFQASVKETITSSAITAQEPFYIGQTTFTLSGGCSSTTPVGSGSSGTFASGTTGSCVTTVTFNGATGMTASHGWNCNAQDWTTPADAILQTATSATTATFTGTTVSGDAIHFACTPY